MTISSIKLLSNKCKLLFTCFLGVLCASSVSASSTQLSSAILFNVLNISGEPIDFQGFIGAEGSAVTDLSVAMNKGLELTHYKLDVDSDCGGIGKIDYEDSFKFASVKAIELLETEDIVGLSISPILIRRDGAKNFRKSFTLENAK